MSSIIIPAPLDKQQTTTEINSKLNKDFSSYSSAATPYGGNEKIALYGTDGNNYYTTMSELATQMGGSGSSQAALVHYVKNCGTISSLPWTNSTIDNNITSDMVVLKAELETPSAQTSDWTCTTQNGYVTISGTISGSTTVKLYFGVSMSTAPSIQVNLASTSADNILKTAPRPGVMGTLGLANGGTGVSVNTSAGLLDALGAVKTSDFQKFRSTSLSGSSYDLNDYYGTDKAGFYYVGLGVVNCPSAYSGLIVISPGEASYQIVIGADGCLYYRRRVGNPASWNNWVCLGKQDTGTITKNASEITDANFHLNNEIMSGTMLIVSGYFYVSTAISANTKIATASIHPQTEVYTSVVSSNGKTGRFKINTSGEIITESALDANSGYYSMTFISNYV